MSIDKTFENLVTAIQSLTEAVNRLAAQPAATAPVAAAPVAAAPVAAAPVAAAPVAAAPVAAAPVAAAPAAAEPVAEPVAEPAAAAPVAEPPASIDMQALTKKALELVKRDGGSKTRLLDAMRSVDPDATSIPTIKPELYADVYNAIDAVLSL